MCIIVMQSFPVSRLFRYAYVTTSWIQYSASHYLECLESMFVALPWLAFSFRVRPLLWMLRFGTDEPSHPATPDLHVHEQTQYAVLADSKLLIHLMIMHQTTYVPVAIFCRHFSLSFLVICLRSDAASSWYTTVLYQCGSFDINWFFWHYLYSYSICFTGKYRASWKKYLQT